MDLFRDQEVQRCASLLSEAKTPHDAVHAWLSLQAKYPELVGIVCLDSYRRRALPQSVKKYTKHPYNYMVPYFETENIYFLDDDLLGTMFRGNEVTFGIDYTLMFDTNIASYINRLVRGECVGAVQNRIVSLVDELLHDDLNTDSLFYMVENVKHVINKIDEISTSKINFWRSLNRDFRKNLVSLQIFRSIDCEEYKRTSNPKALFTYREAARRAVEFAYDFYASKAGREHILDFLILQRLILLQLIGMVKIQVSSRKNAKNKMREYFNFVHEVVGVYCDREAVIAHKYFMDRRNVRILDKFHKGMSTNGLLKKLDNIAWDMASPRFMEKLIVSLSQDGEGRYFIPLFLSFDEKLRDLLSLFPVKGAVFNKDDGSVVPLPKINSFEYFESHGCGSDLEHLFSDSKRVERKSKGKPDRASVHEYIKQEYRELRKIMALTS